THWPKGDDGDLARRGPTRRRADDGPRRSRRRADDEPRRSRRRADDGPTRRRADDGPRRSRRRADDGPGRRGKTKDATPARDGGWRGGHWQYGSHGKVVRGKRNDDRASHRHAAGGHVGRTAPTGHAAEPSTAAGYRGGSTDHGFSRSRRSAIGH